MWNNYYILYCRNHIGLNDPLKMVNNNIFDFSVVILNLNIYEKMNYKFGRINEFIIKEKIINSLSIQPCK